MVRLQHRIRECEGVLPPEARLDEEVLVLLDGPGDGLGHAHLSRPLGAADARDGGVQEGVERRSGSHWVSVCRRAGAPPPWTPDVWTTDTYI